MLEIIEASHMGQIGLAIVVARKGDKRLFAPFYTESEIIVPSTLARNQSIFPKGGVASHRFHLFTN